MTGRFARAATLVLALSLASAAPAQTPLTENTLALDESAARPAATLDDVSLLIGHWRGPFLGGTAEEVWLPPAGGTMVGTFRLVQEDEAAFYELMVLLEEEGSVTLKLKHFNRDLTGWEEKADTVDFPLVKAEADAVYFAGLTYRRGPEGTLQGFLAMGSDGGEMTEATFVYHPVAGHDR